jgi:hypothetical protein
MEIAGILRPPFQREIDGNGPRHTGNNAGKDESA